MDNMFKFCLDFGNEDTPATLYLYHDGVISKYIGCDKDEIVELINKSKETK